MKQRVKLMYTNYDISYDVTFSHVLSACRLEKQHNITNSTKNHIKNRIYKL